MHWICLLLVRLADVYLIIIIAGALLSWVQASPYHPAVRLIRQCTEPVYEFLRRRFPTRWGTVDLSPLILMLGIVFLRRVLLELA